MFVPGEVVAYVEMCVEEGTQLQRGMNYRLPSGRSVFLMSRRRGAPYADRVIDDGRTIVYEGHDVPRTAECPDPKIVDQQAVTPAGSPTQNGLFQRAAEDYRDRGREPEVVRVYEKLQVGLWVFNGAFRLTDAWAERSGPRSVFKFRLELAEEDASTPVDQASAVGGLAHTRVIPSEVKLAVWRRDGGRCVECGAFDNLHFDHVLPYSKGGTSLLAENIQLLCARHNLEKGARLG